MREIENPPDVPHRPDDGHKGTFGNVLVIGGSRGMSGAAVLAGQAALHGGAGLVSLAVPTSIQDIVASAHPSYMTLGLEEDSDGQLIPAACKQINKELDRDSSPDASSRRRAVALGPGIGQSDGASSFAQEIYETCPQPLVLDADGIDAFVGDSSRLTRSSAAPARILTPHPGEFARLLGIPIAEVQLDRANLAASFAKSHNVILVLKGSGTIICDGERIATNQTGNTALATGGSGDVLTGLIASLLAQGMDAFEAAHLGVHLHGMAGEIAGEQFSERFTTSLEIIQCLSTVWIRYQQSSGQQKIGFL